MEFLPSIGTLHQLAFGPGLRVDTGVKTGGVVSPFYDPMIAKLIATGPDRATALQRLLRGLRLTQIAGVKTNRDFLIALLQHPEFVTGHFDTGLIGRDLSSLTDVLTPSPEDWASAALAAMDLPAPGPESALQGFTLFIPLRQQMILTCQDETKRLQVSLNGLHASVVVEAETVSLLRGAKGWCVVGSPQTTAIFAARKAYVFSAQTFVFECLDPLDRTALVENDGAIVAPMPGLVKQVFVSNGQKVVEGDPIVVLEAMKMQHTLRASEAGQVQQLTVRENTQVDAGHIMAVITPFKKGE